MIQLVQNPVRNSWQDSNYLKKEKTDRKIVKTNQKCLNQKTITDIDNFEL